MTLYNLVDNHEGDSLGLCKTKLTEAQIIKMEHFAQIIWGNSNSTKTEIFEELIKKGTLDMMEEEFDDIDTSDIKKILKNSEVILMKSYENKKFKRMTKGYRIKSPFKDKTFEFVKYKEIGF